MKRLLLTGASGFLGYNICVLKRSEWRIFGVVHRRSFEIDGVKFIKADLTQYGAVKRLFREVRPDAVIHTAAATDLNQCQADREESKKINVDASIQIAGLCGEASIPCVFTSSDMVFDGRNAPYREEDPVCPVNIYGEQKVKAEEGMASRYPSTIVCRMPLMFGDPGPVAMSFLQPMLESMRSGKPLRLFVDEFRTPVSGRDAAEGIFLALEEAEGVIHLGGPERISRHDFGVLVREAWRLDRASIVPCLRSDVPMIAPRPSDVSFDSGKAFGMGFQPLSPANELERLFAVEAASD